MCVTESIRYSRKSFIIMQLSLLMALSRSTSIQQIQNILYQCLTYVSLLVMPAFPIMGTLFGVYELERSRRNISNVHCYFMHDLSLWHSP